MFDSSRCILASLSAPQAIIGGLLGSPGVVLGGLGDSLGDPVGDQVRQTLRLCRFARFFSGGPRGFLVRPRDVLGGAWGLLGGTLGVLGRP